MSTEPRLSEMTDAELSATRRAVAERLSTVAGHRRAAALEERLAAIEAEQASRRGGRTLSRARIAATLAELGWHELAEDVRRGIPIKSIEAKVAKRVEAGSFLTGEPAALASAIEDGTL